jgi:hypothetical protein
VELPEPAGCDEELPWLVVVNEEPAATAALAAPTMRELGPYRGSNASRRRMVLEVGALLEVPLRFRFLTTEENQSRIGNSAERAIWGEN